MTKVNSIPNWFHHDKQSLILPDKPNSVKVQQRQGNFIVLVDEKPIEQDYEDYSIKNLTSAGIPLNAVPSLVQPSASEVMSALHELENNLNLHNHES